MQEICVIVINYLDSKMTLRCLESLRNEAFDTLYVADNSADPKASQDFLEMTSAFLETNPPWQLIASVNSENVGFGRAINGVIQADRSKGGGHRRYLLMNNDARGESGFIDGLIEKANESTGIGLVTPRIQWGSEWVCLRWYHRMTGHISRRPLPGSFPYATGCCLLVDHRLLGDDGKLFDERFFMYGEDVLLTWTARQRGFDVVCAESVMIEHEGSASSSRGSYFYEFQVAKGHWILGAALAANSWDRTLIQVLRGVYLSLRALRRSSQFRTTIPVRAFWEASRAQPNEQTRCRA